MSAGPWGADKPLRAGGPAQAASRAPGACGVQRPAGDAGAQNTRSAQAPPRPQGESTCLPSRSMQCPKPASIIHRGRRREESCGVSPPPRLAFILPAQPQGGGSPAGGQRWHVRRGRHWRRWAGQGPPSTLHTEQVRVRAEAVVSNIGALASNGVEVQSGGGGAGGAQAGGGGRGSRQTDCLHQRTVLTAPQSRRGGTAGSGGHFFLSVPAVFPCVTHGLSGLRWPGVPQALTSRAAVLAPPAP